MRRQCACARAQTHTCMCVCLCMFVSVVYEKLCEEHTNKRLFPFSVRRYVVPARLFTQQRARPDFVTETPRCCWCTTAVGRSVGRRRNAIGAVDRRAHEEHTGAHTTHANARRQATGTGGGPTGAQTHTNTNARTQLGASERTLRNNILNAHTIFYEWIYRLYYNTIVWQKKKINSKKNFYLQHITKPKLKNI